jgi:AcrR family transcriptional regulator
MVVTTNRTELRRQATRDALRKVAVARFAERGFDHVTAAEVAEEVGVTERTFYRHFPTKESVLFQDYETRLDWLAGALASRPPTESIFDSVLAAASTFPYDMEIVNQAALLRSSAISGERIAAHLRVVQSSFAAVISEFVRVRRAGDSEIDLLAAVAGNALAGALVAAVEEWGKGGRTQDVDAMVKRSIEMIRSGLRPLD